MHPADDLATALHAAMTAVTVITGRAQLLRRRLSRTQVAVAQPTIAELQRIEATCQILGEDLRAIERHDRLGQMQVDALRDCLEELRELLAAAEPDHVAMRAVLERV